MSLTWTRACMAADVEWWCHLMTSASILQRVEGAWRHVLARGDETDTQEARVSACDLVWLPNSQAKWIGGRQGRLGDACDWDLAGSRESSAARVRVPGAVVRVWWLVRLPLEVGFLGFGCDMQWSTSVLLVSLDEGLMCTDLIGRGMDCLVVGFWHNIEPWWLRDAVESKSSRQTCVISDGDMHVRIFFAC